MANKFVNINCESCGAELAISVDEGSKKCGFCGTLNKPSFDESDSKPASKSRNLMLNAVESDNWEEVSKYSTTILEEDPSDYEAWFYKGAAAGWVSRHIDDPSKEMSNCFRNAFANSDDSALEDVIDLLGSKGADLLLGLARGSRKFAQDHGYLSVGDITMDSWQEDTMNGHISKIFGFIDVAYLLTEINRNDRVNKLNPGIDAIFLKLFAFLHTEVGFEGKMSKKNPFNITDMTFTFVYDPSSELGFKWEPRVDEIVDAFKNKAYLEEDLDKYELSDQSFANPREGDKQESDAAGGGFCFVATAVYGGENHFNLIVLRSFRDNFLNEYLLGRNFINFYYKHGPKLAKRISNYSWLKSLFKPIVDLGVYTVKLFRLG